MGFVFAGLTAVVAIVVYVAVQRLGAKGWAADFKAVSPVTLTPLSVLNGFLLAFIAANVWSNWDRASGFVAHEAAALRHAEVLAATISPDVAQDIKTIIRAHIDRAVTEEWPAMAEGGLHMGQRQPALLDAVQRLLAVQPQGFGQQQAVQHSLAAFEAAMSARRERIMLSEAGRVDLAKWLALFVLAAGLQATIAMVHVDRPRAKQITLVIFTGAAMLCFVVIGLYDRPFHNGVPPTALLEIRPG